MWLIAHIERHRLDGHSTLAFLSLPRVARLILECARRTMVCFHSSLPTSCLSRESPDCPSLRASSDHRFIVGGSACKKDCPVAPFFPFEGARSASRRTSKPPDSLFRARSAARDHATYLAFILWVPTLSAMSSHGSPRLRSSSHRIRKKFASGVHPSY